MELRERRYLRIITNEGLVQQYTRATLSGRDTLSFLPNAFELQLWNLSTSEDCLLSSAKTLQVEVPISRGPQSEIRPSQAEDHRPGDPRWENEWMQEMNVSLSLLAFGTISEVYREQTQQGTITTVTFSPLLPLWTSRVILDVPSGKTVSETVSMILAAAGTQIRLLYYPRYHDPVRSRGQSFSGRAAECISDAVSFAGARAMMAPSGVCIVPERRTPMTTPMIPKTPKKKNFRTWFLGALAVIGAFFAGLFTVRHRENEDDDPHFGEAPSDYLNHVPGFAEPRCTVDIPNLTEAQAQALEACYPQAVRLNPKEAPAG